MKILLTLIVVGSLASMHLDKVRIRFRNFAQKLREFPPTNSKRIQNEASTKLGKRVGKPRLALANQVVFNQVINLTLYCLLSFNL